MQRRPDKESTWPLPRAADGRLFPRLQPCEIDVVVLPRVFVVDVFLVAQHPRSNERVFVAVDAEVPWIVGGDDLVHLRIELLPLRTVRHALALPVQLVVISVAEAAQVILTRVRSVEQLHEAIAVTRRRDPAD